jgi:DNA-binding beta-propeller fold protein YncE
MDTDAAGNLYIADNTHGIYVFDSAGNQLDVIDHSEFNNTTDVKVGPDGNLYVADWAANQVFVLTPDGTILSQFGEEGTGPGQFGTFSPGALAVGPDGTIYVHDDNEDAAGEDYERIQMFSQDGTFQGTFTIEEDFFALSGMDFGPDGSLYLVGFIGDAILQYGPDGTLLGELGEEALDFTGPQGLYIDSAGNFYVSTWSETPIIKLDPQGNLLGTFGVEINDNDLAWGEGGFYQPGGITGLGDGSLIFVTDWSGNFAFITAFTFVE